MSTEQAQRTAAEELGTFVSDLTFADLPEDVVHMGRRVLLDTLGAGISGSTAEEGRRALAGIQQIDHSADVTIWGTDARLSPPGAALVNGTAIHSLEMDDFGGCDHSGAVVIPAVIAIAEQDGPVSGADLLTAIVSGYELARRPMEAAGGYPAHNERGWHSTGTCGSFGAAAASAKMLGLDAQQSAWAIGLAGTYTGGTWAFLEDGAMSKRLHPGKAAENGLVAAYLARKGFTGPTRIFEASWGGFLSTYAGPEADASALTSNLGHDFRIMMTGFKPYASCRGVHSAIDSLLSLKQTHGFGADDVERIIVRANEFNVRMVGNRDIETMLDAQMSLPYGLAVTLLTNQADISQYTPEKRTSPEVRDALARIEMIVDDAVPDGEQPIVEVHMRDGGQHSNRTEIALGDPNNPLHDDALTAKFRGLASLALPKEQVDRIAETVWNIDQVADVSELITLLRRA